MATGTVPANGGSLADFDAAMEEVSILKTNLISQIQVVNSTPKIDVEQFRHALQAGKFELLAKIKQSRETQDAIEVIKAKIFKNNVNISNPSYSIKIQELRAAEDADIEKGCVEELERTMAQAAQQERGRIDLQNQLKDLLAKEFAIITEDHNGAALAYVDPSQHRMLLDDLKNQNSELAVQLATSKAETKEAHITVAALKSELGKSKEATSTAEEKVKIRESDIQLLKETITNHSTSLNKAVQEIGTLKEEIQSKDPLFKVGVAVRSAWFETNKRIWNCGMNIVRGIPDLDLISAKNDATHRGNFCADRSLFRIGFFKTDAQKKEFLYAYGTEETDRPGIATSLFDMRGTLIACGYETRFTHSKKDDTDFATDFEASCKLYRELAQDLNSKRLSVADCVMLWNVNENIARIENMKAIVERTVKKEKERCHS